ncbi:hypothetical protein EVAR_33742_1 [Eumeta japonica]|uniref:Uncharacterized protein n=1 Tax=Eumeta variegata TaxID=151549 RepID=A0A4C1VSU0_EUMVA|nr:hypothetical protein EVAR_33742_1 [Eumeta japonica]
MRNEGSFTNWVQILISTFDRFFASNTPQCGGRMDRTMHYFDFAAALSRRRLFWSFYFNAVRVWSPPAVLAGNRERSRQKSARRRRGTTPTVIVCTSFLKSRKPSTVGELSNYGK